MKAPKFRTLSKLLMLLAAFFFGLYAGHQLLLQERRLVGNDVISAGDPLMAQKPGQLFNYHIKGINEYEQKDKYHPVPQQDMWLNQQAQRRDTVQQVCVSRQSGFPTRNDLLSHLRVNEHHKVVYCAIAKVACTTWKGIFLALHQNKSIQEVSRVNVHNNTLLELNDLVSIQKYPQEDIPRILATYTKMIIVRNPFDRLVSGYTDKILRVNEERNFLYFRPYASKILRRYRGGFNMSEEELVSGVGVTLEEFLHYITDPSIPRRMEHHWQPYQDQCLPCTVHYDYILKLETMRDDTDQLLNRVFHSSLKLKNLNPGKRKSQDQMEKLDADVLRAVHRQYQGDLDMFGYDWPDKYKLSS